MKVFLLSLIFALQQPFDKVDKLIESKQYSDAFDVLMEIDPDNTNPEAFRRKIDICIDGYVMSIGHQLFALKNLDEGEEIKDIRGREGNYAMHSLDVSTIAPTLMEQFPDNYQLKFAVGRYYHSMHLNCGDCSLSAEDCINEFEHLFMECYEHGVYDYFSVYGVGYAKINKQEFEESEPYFLKSIELNDEYPSSHYNLAYAYLYQDDRENAIKYAKNALDRYEYPSYKADAARLIATSYQELQDSENAYTYYTLANEIQPNDFYTLRPLLNVGMYLKKKGMDKVRDDLFQLDTDNPTVYNELIYAYLDYGQISDLISFFESQKPNFQDDYKTLGSLSFYIGKLYLEDENTEKGKAELKVARGLFEKVLEPDHQVFQAIDQILDQN